MVPHKFERWEINPPVDGFICANLSCRIVYIEGNAERFYTLSPNGELMPYPKPCQQS
jgi:hypothetical protein